MKQDLGVDTELVVVERFGEFTVWLDGAKIADKAGGAFPEPSAVVANVRAKLPG